MTPTLSEGSSLSAEAGKANSVWSPFSRQRLLAGALLLCLSILVFLPIFLRGFPSGVDSDRHYRWTLQFSEALAEPGVFYPRWLGSANHHFGSPVSIYYPPLTFFVAAALTTVTNDAQKAMIFSCWLALFLSGLGMYVFARSYFSLRLSLFAASLYMLAPYPLLDLYHGASVAEFWSFLWLPLILHAVTQVAGGRGHGAILYLASTYALLLLTHIPIAFILTLVLPIYALFFTRRFQRLGQIGGGLILGLSLSAFFLLPVALERDYVRINSLLRLDYTYTFLLQDTRLALKTPLFFPNLDYYEAHSGSMKAAKFRYFLKNEQVVLGLPVLLFTSALVCFLHRNELRQDLRKCRLVLASFALTLLSLFMATRYSITIWELIAPLSFLQFPWRWLALATVAVTVLSAAALATALAAQRRRLFSVSLIAVAVLLTWTISGFLIARAPYEDADFDPTVVRREAPEYGPVWWDSELHREEEVQPVSVSSGQADVQVVDGTGARQTYQVRAETDSGLTLRTLYFPGWVVRVDGQQRQIAPSPEGYLQVAVERGEHEVTLGFEDTPPRRVGKIVSLASLLLVFVWLIAARRAAVQKRVQKS